MAADDPTNPALVKTDHRATEEIIEASGAAWTFFRDSQYAEAAAEVIAPVAIMRGNLHGSAGDGQGRLRGAQRRGRLRRRRADQRGP